jgi:Ca2+-transporting ATPase
VFNEFNARSIENRVNVLSGLKGNWVFLGIIAITVGLQILIVELGDKATSTTGLTLREWGWSILMGFGSMPIGVLMRYVPVKEDPESFANFYSFDATDVCSVVLPLP